MEKLGKFLEWGGAKKDVACPAPGGIALLLSIFDLRTRPVDAACVAIILCGIPIILEAVIGLVTAFDIKADVLVSIALIASFIIGEDSVFVIIHSACLLIWRKRNAPDRHSGDRGCDPDCRPVLLQAGGEQPGIP